MIGRIVETSASFEARTAPRSYPTAGGCGETRIPTATRAPKAPGLHMRPILRQLGELAVEIRHGLVEVALAEAVRNSIAWRVRLFGAVLNSTDAADANDGHHFTSSGQRFKPSLRCCKTPALRSGCCRSRAASGSLPGRGMPQQGSPLSLQIVELPVVQLLEGLSLAWDAVDGLFVHCGSSVDVDGVAGVVVDPYRNLSHGPPPPGKVDLSIETGIELNLRRTAAIGVLGDHLGEHFRQRARDGIGYHPGDATDSDW